MSRKNQNCMYKSGNTCLGNITREKNLGILADDKLNTNWECDIAAKKMNDFKLYQQ